MSNDLLRLRWKIAYTPERRWEAYRHDGQQPWYIGAADTQEAAWKILEADRRYWLLRRHATEVRGPQSYAVPGIWN